MKYSYNILDISIYQLRLFLTLAEVRSFSRTSELLNITQPTLSKRIASLENLLGFSLFDRSRPMKLTPSGQLFYTECKDAVEKLEDTVEKLRTEFAVSSITLRLGLPDMGRVLNAISLAAKQIMQEHSEVIVYREYKSYDSRIRVVVDHEVDIMFVCSKDRKGLSKLLISEEVTILPMLAVLLRTNPLSRKNTITCKDLSKQRFIFIAPSNMSSRYDEIREYTLKYGGFEPIISRYVQTGKDLIGSIVGNDEVVICDTLINELDSDTLKVFELPEFYSGLTAVWRRDNKNPHIPYFIELTKENFNKYPLTVQF